MLWDTEVSRGGVLLYSCWPHPGPVVSGSWLPGPMGCWGHCGDHVHLYGDMCRCYWLHPHSHGVIYRVVVLNKNILVMALWIDNSDFICKGICIYCKGIGGLSINPVLWYSVSFYEFFLPVLIYELLRFDIRDCAVITNIWTVQMLWIMKSMQGWTKNYTLTCENLDGNYTWTYEKLDENYTWAYEKLDCYCTWLIANCWLNWT